MRNIVDRKVKTTLRDNRIFLSLIKIFIAFFIFSSDNKKLIFFKASVAQQAEQLICNQWVGGSIPFAGFNMDILGEVPEWLKGADCKSAGSAFGGSNPPLSTIQWGRKSGNSSVG
jgi:hypothetical protein